MVWKKFLFPFLQTRLLQQQHVYKKLINMFICLNFIGGHLCRVSG